MQKIHVTRQFSEASGRHGDLIEKTKNLFSDKVNGSMCAKFQVCIVFSLAKRSRKPQQTYLQVKIEISSTGCSPHVDFDNANGNDKCENIFFQ